MGDHARTIRPSPPSENHRSWARPRGLPQAYPRATQHTPPRGDLAFSIPGGVRRVPPLCTGLPPQQAIGAPDGTRPPARRGLDPWARSRDRPRGGARRPPVRGVRGPRGGRSPPGGGRAAADAGGAGLPPGHCRASRRSGGEVSGPAHPAHLRCTGELVGGRRAGLSADQGVRGDPTARGNLLARGRGLEPDGLQPRHAGAPAGADAHRDRRAGRRRCGVRPRRDLVFSGPVSPARRSRSSHSCRRKTAASSPATWRGRSRGSYRSFPCGCSIAADRPIRCMPACGSPARAPSR